MDRWAKQQANVVSPAWKIRVDVGAKSEIHKIIRALAKDGLAVLMISSDLPEVLGMSDRIAVMRGGELTAILPGSSDAHTVMSAALGKEAA